jgi:hypothetical protein
LLKRFTMSKLPFGVQILVHAVGLAVLALLVGCSGPVSAGTSAPIASTNATTTSTSDIVFQDALTTNAHGWTTGQHILIKADGLHIVGGYYVLAPVATPPVDIEVSVRATRVAGPDTGGYGIVMRRTPSNRYEFDITGKGEWYVLNQANGQFSYLVDQTPNAAIKTGLGATNVLKVRALGAHFEFWINGVKVGEVSDAGHGDGLFGLDGDYNLDVAYTDLLAVAVH